MPTTNYVNYFTEALQIQSLEEEKKWMNAPTAYSYKPFYSLISSDDLFVK